MIAGASRTDTKGPGRASRARSALVVYLAVPISLQRAGPKIVAAARAIVRAAFGNTPYLFDPSIWRKTSYDARWSAFVKRLDVLVVVPNRRRDAFIGSGVLREVQQAREHGVRIVVFHRNALRADFELHAPETPSNRRAAIVSVPDADFPRKSRSVVADLHNTVRVDRPVEEHLRMSASQPVSQSSAPACRISALVERALMR